MNMRRSREHIPTAAYRLRRAGKAVGLTRTDIDILQRLLRCQTQPLLEAMIEENFGYAMGTGGALSPKRPKLPALLGKPASAIQARFAVNQPLLHSGPLPHSPTI